MPVNNSDLDGDRRSEILVTSPWGVGVLEQSGATLTSLLATSNGTRFEGGWLLNTADNRFDLVGDFTGDGRHEILVTSPWGIGVLQQQAGGSFRTLLLAPNGTRFGGWLLNTVDNRFGPIGDFDGDGKMEILVTSPWGIGIFKVSGNTITVPVIAPNGTRFGGWLLNTADNRFGPVGDTDGNGHDELLISSPWGIGLLELSGASLVPLTMAPNGTRFGGWLLNTADSHFGTMADYDGDGRDEILVTSPWGLGILKPSGGTLTSLVMASNGTQIGSWLLNTLDNRLGPVSDYNGDGRDEVLLVSPWGIGVLNLTGNELSVPMMAPNGTRFGGWLLNTEDNRFDMVGDFDGDGHAELLVTSPWGIGILKLTGSTMSASAMAQNGTPLGAWRVSTSDNHFGIGMELVRLHVKILDAPTVSIERMLVAMQQVCESIGIRVQRVSTETLSLAALEDLDVGSCSMGSVTAEQTQLFANRNYANSCDVVVYFVRSTVPPLNGCAAHPQGRPAAVIARGATVWTLAHEVGHVLGLRHVNDNARLMTGNGTSNITNWPPDLVASEVIEMRESTLTHAV